MNWDELELGFQVAFEAAWEAYLGGSLPIGAAIVNENNQVVAIGRNRIFEKDAPSPQIFNHQLAHAETNAILQLNEYENHPNIRSYVLYTVMEPCPFCFGAIAMGSIKHVKYAARDGWAGATSLIHENKYLHNKQITVEGPFTKLEQLQLAWQGSIYYSKRGNDDIVLWNWNEYCPEGVAAAKVLYKEDHLAKLAAKGASAREAFEFTMTLLDKPVKEI